MAKSSWKLGMKLVHRAQPGWGVGAVLGTAEEGRFLRVLFAGRADGPVVLSTRDPALAPYRFPPGAPVRIGAAREPGIVLGEKDEREGFTRYDVETYEGEQVFDERELFAPPPEQGPDPGEQFREPEGLRHVVVGAGVETHDGIDLVGPRGEDQHGYTAPLGANPAAHLKAV